MAELAIGESATKVAEDFDFGELAGDDAIRFTCACGKRLKIPPAMVGMRLKCTSCGRRVRAQGSGENPLFFRTPASLGGGNGVSPEPEFVAANHWHPAGFGRLEWSLVASLCLALFGALLKAIRETPLANGVLSAGAIPFLLLGTYRMRRQLQDASLAFVRLIARWNAAIFGAMNSSVPDVGMVAGAIASGVGKSVGSDGGCGCGCGCLTILFMLYCVVSAIGRHL